MESSPQNGQASVELLAVFPLILLTLLGGWQIALGGHTWWKLREAARIGARAHYVAEQRGDSRAGLRRAKRVTTALLDETPANSRRVSVARSGTVTVTTRIPLVIPLREVLGSDAAPRITARSRFMP